MIIDKNKIYSSYFARAVREIPDKYLVSIAVETPSNWKGSYCRELNPPKYLLYKFKNREISEEEFKYAYINEVLSNLDAMELYNKLKGKVICCWERAGDFCHRQLVMDWMESKIGSIAIGSELKYE